MVALATVLEDLRSALEAHEPDVRHDVDPEALHDFRVAIRRTRSVLRLARRDARELYEAWNADWAWLAGVTGQPRDLDVLLSAVRSASSVPPSVAPGVVEVIGQLEVDRARAHTRLEEMLDGERYASMKARWRTALADLEDRPMGVGASVFAETLVRRAAKQFARHASGIDTHTPAPVVHDLRKRNKRLRYALQLFGDVMAVPVPREVSKRAKRLQDDLGEFQDNDVHHRLMTERISREDASPLMALAGGHFIEGFAAHRQAVLDALPADVDRFVDCLERTILK